jgi:hypothetical protein
MGMLQDLKELNVQVAKPEVAAPDYSLAFVRMVTDAAYEALRAYLVRRRETGAVRLLDSLVVLENLRSKKRVTWVDNQMAMETVLMASKEMEKLGFKFGELKSG